LFSLSYCWPNSSLRYAAPSVFLEVQKTPTAPSVFLEVQKTPAAPLVFLEVQKTPTSSAGSIA